MLGKTVDVWAQKRICACEMLYGNLPLEEEAPSGSDEQNFTLEVPT